MDDDVWAHAVRHKASQTTIGNRCEMLMVPSYCTGHYKSRTGAQIEMSMVMAVHNLGSALGSLQHSECFREFCDQFGLHIVDRKDLGLGYDHAPPAAQYLPATYQPPGRGRP